MSTADLEYMMGPGRTLLEGDSETIRDNLRGLLRLAEHAGPDIAADPLLARGQAVAVEIVRALIEPRT